MNVQNARIINTHLGTRHTDHGIQSFYITLDYGGSAQGFGGFVLDTYDKRANIRTATTLASSLLLAIDGVFHCDWEELPKQVCRAYGSFDKIYAIGNYLEDKWLWFDEAHMGFIVTPFEVMRQGAEAKIP